MAFKAQKLNIDLTLDLTEYIPEKDGGILTTDKTDAESINKWFEVAVEEGSKLQKYNKNNNQEEVDIIEMSKQGKQSIMKQIDYFYGKGEKFYNKIPMPIMYDILKYINGQLSPAKKKLTN